MLLPNKRRNDPKKRGPDEPQFEPGDKFSAASDETKDLDLP